MLAGKRILLGVSGGIAAYQAVDLIGLLRSHLADVRVIMTKSATEFITPLTLETVSNHPVSVGMFDERNHFGIEHIALGRRADIVILAPATGNLIGKIAHGIADDLLTTTVMAAKAPMIICPAMNENMWLNPLVQENVAKLKRLGYHLVDPEYGEMACGGEGWGRLARLDRILTAAMNALATPIESLRQVAPGEDAGKSSPEPVPLTHK